MIEPKLRTIDKNLGPVRGADGYSPTVAVEDIEGGHRVTITDKSGAKSIDVLDGATGPQGPAGEVTTEQLNAALAPVAQATDSTTVGPAPVVSFDAAAAGMPLKSVVVNIEPVQEGEGDPSPENVRPIRGWTGCNMYRAGKNLLDGSLFVQGTLRTEDGTELNNVTRVRGPFLFLHSGTYTISINSGFDIVCYVYNLQKQYIQDESYQWWINKNNRTISLLGDRFVRILFRKPDNTTIQTTDITNAQLELGSTATAYKPYQGNTYDVSFPSEAGTVYGGTLDVTSGELTVAFAWKHASDLTWTKNANLDHGFNGAGFTERKTGINSFGRNDLFCDTYQWFNSNPPNGLGPDTVSGIALAKTLGANSTLIYIVDNRFDNVSDFVESFATHDPLIVLPLATPVTYKLTPQEVTTLLGQNNIWADCGDVSVTYGVYLETVKAHADRLGDSILESIAPLETTYTASRNYSIGAFLFVGTKFYRVNAAIATGAAITPGTNVTQTTIAEQLMTLAANI